MIKAPTPAFWGLTGLLLALFGTAGWLTKEWIFPRPVIEKKYVYDEPFFPPKVEPDLGQLDVVLDEEQRNFLWKVEHEVLVVNGYWFKDFAKALAEEKREALLACLAADFKGQTLNQPTETAMTNEYARVYRHEDSGLSRRSLNSTQFVEELLNYRKMVGTSPKVSIKVKNLTPINRAHYEGDWEGTALFRMTGEVDKGQPVEVVMEWTFQITTPKPEHNTPGWCLACGITQVRVANGKHFLFQDVTQARGLDSSRYTDDWKTDRKTNFPGGIYLCDFNRDGIPDLLVTDINTAVTLFQGMPDGKLRDVTVAMGLPTTPHYFKNSEAVSVPSGWADLDGDGWEDLILFGHVYRNDSGKGFVDVTKKTNLRLPLGCNNLVFGDFDRDGKVDIYVTRPGLGKTASWLDGHSGTAEGNQLWRNLGNWQFEDVTKESGTSGNHRSTFSAAWVDINNDGWPDLYVPNEFGNGVLLINQKNGTFKEKQLVQGPSDFGTMGLAAGDLNNDGHIDLFMANMFSKAGMRIVNNLKPGTYSDEVMAKLRRMVSGNQLYLNRGDLNFEARGKELAVHDVGWAHGPNLFDLNNDGFLDIYCTTGFVSVNRDEPDG